MEFQLSRVPTRRNMFYLFCFHYFFGLFVRCRHFDQHSTSFHITYILFTIFFMLLSVSSIAFAVSYILLTVSPIPLTVSYTPLSPPFRRNACPTVNAEIHTLQMNSDTSKPTYLQGRLDWGMGLHR